MFPNTLLHCCRGSQRAHTRYDAISSVVGTFEWLVETLGYVANCVAEWFLQGSASQDYALHDTHAIEIQSSLYLVCTAWYIFCMYTQITDYTHRELPVDACLVGTTLGLFSNFSSA